MSIPQSVIGRHYKTEPCFAGESKEDRKQRLQRNTEGLLACRKGDYLLQSAMLKPLYLNAMSGSGRAVYLGDRDRALWMTAKEAMEFIAGQRGGWRMVRRVPKKSTVSKLILAG